RFPRSRHASVWARSVLYKWRYRALTALQRALTDHRPGPQCPANRLSPAQEQPLVALAQRHPTWSATQIYAQAGPEAPAPRTIQRLRHRYALPRLPKRPAPVRLVRPPNPVRAAGDARPISSPTDRCVDESP